jgi:hypothetical protein
MLKLDLFSKFYCRIGGVAIISIIFVLLYSGCSLKSPYVGRMVNTENWAKYFSGENITFPTDAANFELTITKTKEDEEYFLEGTMDGSEGSLKSISHLVASECRFNLLLAKNNVIVDSISFFPIGDDHTRKLAFKRKFKTVPFDSVTLIYTMSVRG